jgi:ketosteroid isomerase-like protein
MLNKKFEIMKKGIVIITVLFALFFVSCSDCGNKVDLIQDNLDIEHLLENYIIANETQDFVLIESIWSDESDIILYGTDSHERLTGWDNIRDAIKSQFGHIEDTYISASDQVIKINCTGNTAWFAEAINYNFMYNGEAKKFEGLRFTGVVLKIDGNWKLVQAHLSVPASIGVGK